MRVGFVQIMVIAERTGMPISGKGYSAARIRVIIVRPDPPLRS